MPAWKGLVGHVAAFFVAALFLVAGVWKAIDPYRFARLAEDLLVPYQLSLALALALAVAETTAGVLILVPRFRRWGAWLASALLLVFMIYVGVRYSDLIGRDCSCFPWVKRTVGPGFFMGDAGFLLAALVAGWWAQRSESIRGALVVLGSVAVFAGVSYGMAFANRTGAKAPESVIVDGKPMELGHGRFFLFFYDPECGHCDAAAKGMSKLKWKSDITIIAIPTRQQHWAAAFLKDTGLKAVTSLELEKLKAAFPLPGDPPYGVVIDRGRQTGAVPTYVEDGPEPADTLRKLEAIE